LAIATSNTDRGGDPPSLGVVFRGSRAACLEFALVLEAKAIEHELAESEGTWTLSVAPPLLYRAYDELDRYAHERAHPRLMPTPFEPFAGAALGGIGYALILLFTAYCAGAGLFGADWLSLGALDAGAARQWWRAITALTLHLDQAHLLGNLLFGISAGVAAGRLLGPGLAWASILGAAALANYGEILVAPPTHRAVGASTAVFAALGLLAGLAWRQRLTLREGRWYRWAPPIAGVCLLTFLGAGTEHVDVLGHGLGFIAGTTLGWLYAKAGIPRSRSKRLQVIAAAGAALLVCVAWVLALRPA
jgi:rhomboid protease GluP